jgi:bifunctional aspartate aminotransferase and glutamate/aspartate-prephenate aminotransferase
MVSKTKRGSLFATETDSIDTAATADSTDTVKAAAEDSKDFLVPLNPLIQSIAPSATVAIFSQVQELQAQGIAVTSLCVGEPDFAPPPAVNQAVVTALSNTNTAAAAAAVSYTRYTAVKGTLALRTAIANDLQARKGAVYNPATEIIVSSGAKPSVFGAVWSVAGSGSHGNGDSSTAMRDGVLIPAPYWTSYPEQVALCGAVPVIVDTDAASGYKLTASQLRTALESGSANQNITIRALILCHPSNPTGSVYTRDELQALCTVLYEHPYVTVISDEIYERLVFDDVEHVSVAALPNMWHRTITINGVSKSHAMTGYRIGYAAAPPHYIAAMTTIQSQLASCACSLSQHAAVAALTLTTDDWMSDVVRVMETKRNYVWSRLLEIPHIAATLSQSTPPAGAFYVLVDISAYLKRPPNASTSTSSSSSTPDTATANYATDTELCLALLQRQRLAVVPGSAFGAPGTMRLSYATDMDTLVTAMDKLVTFLATIRS